MQNDNGLESGSSLTPGSNPLFNREAPPTNAYEETLRRLLQSIRLGVVEPGAKLPSERELAASFNVSRDTVRDVLATLGDAGYVTAKRGRYGGTFVSPRIPRPRGDDPLLLKISDEELREIILLRRIIETGVVREIARKKLSAAEEASLLLALEECLDAPLKSYRRLDSRLHLVLAELTGSKKVVELFADVRSRTNTLLDSFPKLLPNIEHSNRQHKEIVQAVLEGDEEAAVNAMLSHLEGSEALILGFLSRD